jgi:hypothetical protein
VSARPAGFRQTKPLTADEARALTDEIRGDLSATYLTVAPKIVAAYRGRAWNALGFTSWDEYCKSEFRGPRMVRFTDEQLDDIVNTLAGEGLPSRGIASAVGIGHATAARKTRNKTGEVISLNGARRKREDNRGRQQAMADHPAGKALPATIDFAGLKPAETILLFIAESGSHGMTYTELCDILKWRDAPVTGALSTLKRTAKITAGWVRNGHVAWVSAGTDVLA